MRLDAATLDEHAERYYLNSEVADVDIEELGQERSLDRTLQALGGARRVLDLGFGTGRVAAEALARGLAFEVVEGSPRLCAVARERHPGLVVHDALFEDFAPEEPYDAVLALHVLEHVEDPVALLARIAGWLAPGGAVVCVVPNAASLHRRLAVRMGLQPALDTLSARDHLVGHQRVFTPDGLRDALTAAGLEVAETFGYQLKVVPNAMMAAWPPALWAALVDISPEVPPELLANLGMRAVRPR
jgi:2-polyprenyl-3-methyl-5-hydroxy-6-metoxy-1,4-benzoquinol methylase